MSFTPNYFSPLLALQGVSESQAFFETRIENDSSGNPLFIGWSLTPNAATTAAIWQIIKMSYDGGGYLSRSQIPDDGQKYGYVWNDRSSYFS